MARSRDPLFLLVAIGVHAAGLLSAGAIARLRSEVDQGSALPANGEITATGASEIRFVDIDLVPEKPASAPEIAAEAPVGGAAIGRRPDVRIAHSDPGRREHRDPLPHPSEPSPIAEPAPIESSAAPDPGWLPNEEPERAPGLSGAPIWTIPGVLTAPSAAQSKQQQSQAQKQKPLGPRAVRAEAALPANDASEQQKQTALLPSAGTLASAVAEEVGASSAPLTSESHFVLTLDGQGRLVSAEFVSANEGDRAAWERVARAVSKRFAGKTMPMPSAYAGGGKVYVTIRSQVVMPDGTSHGTPTPRSIQEKAPDNEYSRIDSPLNDRFRSPDKSTSPAPNTITVGIPFVFDVANIGATRRRVVRAQVRAVPTPASP